MKPTTITTICAGRVECGSRTCTRIMPVAGGGFDQCYNAQAVVATPTRWFRRPIVALAILLTSFHEAHLH